MGEDLQIRRLLEQSLESGLTPEDVCTFNPDLLPKVRQRWERCRRIEAELDSLFSTGDQAGSSSATDSEACAELPRIDGYSVESILGRGGVGVVFKAREIGSDRVVALKMLLAGANASPLERARFLRETHSVSALKHANIVQIHDVGESAGLYFFTMEYLPGGTLAERLAAIKGVSLVTPSFFNEFTLKLPKPESVLSPASVSVTAPVPVPMPIVALPRLVIDRLLPLPVVLIEPAAPFSASASA